jgi:hypothetical protein
MRLPHLRVPLCGMTVLVCLAGCSSNYNSTSGGGTAPAISTQPANATVNVGHTATFTVVATGTPPLYYQWQKNRVNISGASGATYTTPAVVSGDDGEKFDVLVTNSYGSVTSAAAALTVNSTATLQSIAVTPPSPSVAVGSTQQFTATGTYSDSSTGDITTGVTWSSSNTAFATIGPNTGLATGVAAGTTQISASLSGVVSPNDPLTVIANGLPATDVVTHHYDRFRTGANTHEIILTTASVNSATFGKVAEFSVDGQIDGQILFLNQVAFPGLGNKNVLYFATEKDSVYAVDADTVSGSTAIVLWKTSALATGESPIGPSDIGCGYINPVGIMSTPVIDRSRNAIYVVATSKDGAGNYFHRLHALDLSTGKELFGGPTTITTTFPGTGGNSSGGIVTFRPVVQQERAALLESGGAIFTAWSGYYGDCGNYSAWVISYSADTLQQLGAIDLVPATAGAGIWLGGGGPAADAQGNVYLATGNAFGGNTPGVGSNYGDSFVKLSGASPLAVADYFAPSNAIMDDNADLDLGSAAPLLLPDLVDSSNVTRHLAVIAGKDGALYVLNRDNLGQYSASRNNVYQELANDGHENFSSPVYINGSVYLGPSGLPLRAFSVSQALLSSTPSSQTPNSFGGTGTVPSVSSNGNSNGIVWALDYSSGTLYAYDASDLSKELYNSKQAAAGRDNFAAVGGHFITPVVANGKVYFGTGSTVAVFGLLP